MAASNCPSSEEQVACLVVEELAGRDREGVRVGRARHSGESDRGQSQNNKPVINLLTVEGEEQVMLKVRFAEMQRSVTKRLQSSLGIRTPDPTRSVNVEAGTGANLNGAVSVAGGGGFTTAQTGGFGVGFTAGSTGCS